MTEIFKPRDNMVNGDIFWECHDEDGNLICDGGPSQIWDDGKQWNFYDYRIGLHRLDGPAISWGDWYIAGKNVTREIKIFAKENDIDLDNLSDEDKVLIALKFG